MKLFKNRAAAGKLLAAKLKGIKADLVLGIPRGGVVVGREIARSLNLSLDIVVTRKIGAPSQEELALGAIDADGEIVWDHKLLTQLKLKIANLKFKINEEMAELKRREKLYREGRVALDLSDKTVILVDDGVATGATTLSAARYIRRHQTGSHTKLILAVPVISLEAVKKLKPEVDELVVLHIPEYFQAVGQFYHQFEPVTDEEVIQLLKQ